MPNDIILDENLDLKIDNGDFVIGDSTSQHQTTLIFSDKCEYKENPMRGVGVRRYLESAQTEALAREIRQEFMIDGMEVNNINIGENATIEVDAFYS